MVVGDHHRLTPLLCGRYLGKVRRACSDVKAKQAILAHLIARTFRKHLQNLMRETGRRFMAERAAASGAASANAAGAAAGAATATMTQAFTVRRRGSCLLCATALTCDGAHSTQAGSAAEQHILSVATTMLASSFNLHATTPAPAQQRALLKSRLCAQFPDALTEDEWQWDHCLWQQLPTGMRRFVLHLVQDLTGIQVAIRARRRASCCCLIRNGLIPCVQMRVMATTVTDAHGTEHRVTRFTATSMQPQSKRLQLPHVCLLAMPAGCGVSTVPMPHAMTL